LLDTAGNSIW
jgi:hypothetical protein